VHGANAANRTTDFRPVKRLVNNLPNGASAAAALGTAAKAAIDMARGTTRCQVGGGTYIVVAQYIAGTDDHWKLTFKAS
jgi:hypothetical protein